MNKENFLTFDELPPHSKKAAVKMSRLYSHNEHFITGDVSYTTAQAAWSAKNMSSKLPKLKISEWIAAFKVFNLYDQEVKKELFPYVFSQLNQKQ